MNVVVYLVSANVSSTTGYKSLYIFISQFNQRRFTKCIALTSFFFEIMIIEAGDDCTSVNISDRKLWPIFETTNHEVIEKHGFWDRKFMDSSIVDRTFKFNNDSQTNDQKIKLCFKLKHNNSVIYQAISELKRAGSLWKIWYFCDNLTIHPNH